MNFDKKLNSRLVFMWFLILLLNCNTEPTGDTKDNVPPETSIAVTATGLVELPDTTGFRLELAWSGDDPDGEVVGFEYAFNDTSEWIFTVATADTFDILNRDSTFTRTTFIVRAIDNDGAVDPTPAVQLYQTLNAPPKVNFNPDLAPQPIVLNFVTIFWEAGVDRDVGGEIENYEFKLDTDADFRSVPGDVLSVTLERVPAGERSFTLRARDNGGFVSEEISTTFTSLPVAGRILLLDDASSAIDRIGINSDQFYRILLESIAPEEIMVWNINTFFPTFDGDFTRVVNENDFEIVFWYSGDQSHFRRGEEGLRQFLETGNNAIIISPIAANQASDSFSDEFRREFLHITGFSQGPNARVPSENFFYVTSRQQEDIVSVIPETYPTLDFPTSLSSVRGMDGVLLDEPNAIAIYTLPFFALDPGVIVGHRTRELSSGGGVFMTSIPIALADGLGNVEEPFRQLIINDFGFVQ